MSEYTEKVLQEFKVTETEDGFRIEIKGDKEKLKAMGFGEGMSPFMRGFGGGRHREHGQGHEHGRGHGPGRGFRHMRRMRRHAMRRAMCGQMGGRGHWGDHGDHRQDEAQPRTDKNGEPLV